MGYRETYEAWLADARVDEASKAELKAAAADEKELEDRFYRELEFGTAGLRGVMAAGTARLNRYTVAQATQGLAQLIKKKRASARGVAIAYDSRNHSREYAEVAARVLAPVQPRKPQVPLLERFHRARQIDDARHLQMLRRARRGTHRRRRDPHAAILRKDHARHVSRTGRPQDRAEILRIFQKKAKMIPFDTVEYWTGFAPGGVCPFALKEGVDVYLDESLKKYDTVFPAAGSGSSAIEMTMDQLERLTGYREWVDVVR